MESNNLDKIYNSLKESDEKLKELEDLKLLLSNDEIKTLSLIDHIVNIENNQNQIVQMLEKNERFTIMKQYPSYFLSMVAIVIAVVAILNAPHGWVLILAGISIAGIIFKALMKNEINRINKEDSH